MSHPPPPSVPRKRLPMHQHDESEKWALLPANQKYLECYPVGKPFLETALGKMPPEIRELIFKYVLTVGCIPLLKDGISVPMVYKKQDVSENKLSIGLARPASCLALVQTCRQIYYESSLLFYSLNTFFISGPQTMLSSLQHLGPERCNSLQSLHLYDILEEAPIRERSLDQLGNKWSLSKRALEMLANSRGIVGPATKTALTLLNKSGKIQKIYLDIRPSQTLEYIKIITMIPGFEHRGIVFESPTRWSVTCPSPAWKKRKWLWMFAEDMRKSNAAKEHAGFLPYEYLRGNDMYRVVVEIHQAPPEEEVASLDDDSSWEDFTDDEGSAGVSSMECPSISWWDTA